jgi:diguanylate cyclase (GGDEF)-like protein
MPTQPIQLASSEQLRTRILRVVGWTMGSLTCFATLFRASIAPLQPQIMFLALALSMVLLALPFFGSGRRWTPRLGIGVTLVSMVLVLSTGYLAGGLDAPVVTLLMITPLLGVVLVSRRFGAGVALLVVLSLVGMLGLHRLGVVPPSQLSGEALLIMRGFMLSIGLMVMAAAIYIYDQHSHELVHRFQRDALTDVLTGLHNRRYLDMAFPQLAKAAAAQGSEVWLALIDVDHFKRINDTQGHEGGDLALQQVAMALRATSLSLPGAIVARIAGDEFVVVSAGRRGHLRALMDRAKSTLARLPGVSALSISVGMAGLPVDPADGDLLRQLLARADAALYRAKQNGRGRVMVTDVHLSQQEVPSGRRSREPRSRVALGSLGA